MEVSKNWAVPEYARAPFSPTFFSCGFVRMDPVNVPAKSEVHSFTRSLDNEGSQKISGSPRLCVYRYTSSLSNVETVK